MTIESHQPIHDLYCKITDRQMPCTTAMHFQWNAWKSKGWTEDDLKLVVAHIKALIKKDRRRSESLRFHNLIGDTERFNEDLAEARAYARRPAKTARDKILEATGRPPKQPDRVRSAADILAGSEAFKQFVALKNSL